jgi:hypothetical protein
MVQRTLLGDALQHGASTFGESASSRHATSGRADQARSHKEPDEEELRNLAKRIYPYISQRLKVELRRDRERAGMITGLHR